MPAIFSARDARPVVLFDGVCNLCNMGVNMILDGDRCDPYPDGNFRFAALQSEVGKALLKRVGRKPDDFSSILVVRESGFASKSAAVLELARGMQQPFRALGWAGRLLPPPLANALYAIVSRMRKRIFGEASSCRLMDPRWETRFVSDETIAPPSPPAAATSASVEVAGGEGAGSAEGETKSDTEAVFAVGERVRVTTDAVFFHGSKKDFPSGLSCLGLGGAVVGIAGAPLTGGEGERLSASRPVVVQLEEPKLRVHFQSEELRREAPEAAASA